MKQENSRSEATSRLARFVNDTHYKALPDEVIAAAKIGILDGIGVMLAGAAQPLASIVGPFVRDLAGAPLCGVVGQDFRTNAPSAAFANGIFLHCLDFEIQGQPATHGTSAVLPPVLALGEMLGAPGSRLIEAYVVGWEVQARLRRASVGCDLRGYHPPGVFGPLGAAAACAKMLGLSSAQTRMALGIAASHTGGLLANLGNMVKGTHAGAAGRHGVEAALLAQAGYVSHEGILEAKHGYVDTLLGVEFDWATFTDRLGTTFQLVDPGFNIKRYPVQIHMQWAIDAVLNLRQRHQLRPEEIDYLELEVPQVRVRPDDAAIQSGPDGKSSYAYCGAVALTQGHLDIDSFSDATYSSPQVQDVLRKVRLKGNPDIPASLLDTWAAARAGLRDGRVVSEQCLHYRGSIANPMTREERLEKTRTCGGLILNSADMERVIDMGEVLEALPDVRELTRILEHKSVK